MSSEIAIPRKYYIYVIVALCGVIVKLFAWGNAKDVEIKKANESLILLYREVGKYKDLKARNEILKKIDSI